MFKNAVNRIYLLLAGVIAILGIVSVGSNYYFQRLSIEADSQNRIINYHQRFQTYINEEAMLMESFLKLIEEKQNLQSEFITSDKEKLFNSAEPIFKHLNKDCDITHFYFIKPDGKVLLRVHDFERDSDIIQRYTFLKAKEKNEIFYGIEFGLKKNYTLRVVAPWIVDGKLIGYIELGKEIDKINETFSKQLEMQIFYAVEKSQYKDITKQYLQTKKHYIAYGTLPSNQHVVDFIDNYTNQPQWIEFDNKHFIAYSDTLQDVSKKSLGVKVFLMDVTKQYHELVLSILYYISIMILGTLLMLRVVYYFVRKKQLSLDDALLEIESKTVEQKNLLSLFDKGDSVLFRWNNDKEWSINYVSSNVENLLGYSKDEFLDSTVLYASCIHKDDLARVFEEVKKGQESQGEFFKHEPYRIITKNGDIKWVLDYTVLDKDVNGDVLHFLGYILDITKEQENEQAIKIQKEKFETIFKYSKDGIAILDLESNFVNFNDAYLEITGFTREELLQKSCIGLTAPEYKEQSIEALKKVFEIGHIENFEKVCIVQGGRRIVTNMSVSLLPHREGLLLVTKDVTSLKLLEEQTKLASMGEMIANIAHQWRQPLSVISTNATGLLMQQEYGILNDEKLIESCNQINDNAQYLSKTIDDFRNFIKGDVEFSLVNMSQVINEVLNILNPTISSSYINVVLSIEDDMLINANKNELEQAFINIINNAKDTLLDNVIEEDRAIFISTKGLDSKNLEVKICDNGGGIPLDIIDKIFEPYFTTKHKSRGTGLGLSMVDKIIRERHNQTLSVYNEEFEYHGKNYKGACFVIVFTMKD